MQTKATKREYDRLRRLNNPEIAERRRAQVKAWAKANKAQRRPVIRRYRIKKLYNITEADYDAMVIAQGNCCKICGKAPKLGKRLHIDHCHKTNKVRGLLCWNCNYNLLGRFRDNATLFESAARYLRESQVEQ